MFLKNENVYLQCKKINKNKNKKVMRTKINSQSTEAVNSASKCIVNALEKSLKKINKIENSDNPMFTGWVKVLEDVRMVVSAGRCYDAETQTYVFSGTFTLESKNHKGEYTDDVCCLVGVTSTERMTDDQCVNYVIEEFIKVLDSLMTEYNSGPFSGIGRNAYLIKYCYFGGAKNEAPSLDEAPMLEEDDDVIVGYSVEGLAYVRENLEDVDIVSMVKESMGDLFNDPYTMESIMRGGVLDQEKFADALWDIVWEEFLCGLTDEALESETRYYTDFDALCLQLCGAVAAYNEVMRVVKNNADSVTYGAQGFSWDLFTEETMLTLMANNDLVDMLRKSLFTEVGCSDLLVYDDCLYLWYNNNSWETSIVTAA